MPDRMTPEERDRLADSLDILASEVEDLRATIRWAPWQRIALIVAALATAASLGLGALGYRHTQSAVASTKHVAASTNHLAQVIRSCTDQHGACARRGAAAQAAAIGSITDPRVRAVVAWCGAHSATRADAVTCAVHAVAALPPSPAPSPAAPPSPSP